MDALSRQSYRRLAPCYDKLFGEFRGPIDAAREHVLGRFLSQVEKACDLGCGTGTTAVALARLGIQVYAVDASVTMCRLARRKARRAGVPLRVIQADMRTFELPEPLDLITCEGDALNHVPSREDLRLVAKAVERALRPAGRFFFEVNNARGFARYWKGTVWFEKRGVVAVMRNGHDLDARRAWSDIEMFVREGRYWRRRRDHVEEVCWEPEEVRRVFEQAGFAKVRVWDPARFFQNDPMITRGCRSIYVASKAAG